MKIESRIGKSTFTEEAIYTFISDFTNFKDFLPTDKVRDWEASADHCSFNLPPLGKTGLRIIDKEPFKLIKISTDKAESKYGLTLWIQLKEAGPGDTRIKLTAEPDVNPMLASMIKGQVASFLDQIVERIETFSFPVQS